MTDYKNLCYKTFNTITEVEQMLSECTKALREVQKECEEIYIKSEYS